MKRKDFIIYPKTKIDIKDDMFKVVDAPIKVQLQAFITGYIEDYGESPSIKYLQSVFRITEQDAEIALYLYGKK
ncbi:hypothetical protein [Bacillus coahuilensis]|uniref:hypothetical protein n=1 Tax=Bacillus coahuilensis TaxID=408580 RepID=UPI0001850FCE|nr:hypothetical protein [Bacillus coahuilensis]